MPARRATELDQAGDTCRCRRLIHFLADMAEPERAESRYIGHAQQIVKFLKRAYRTPFAFCATSFCTLHQTASPSVRGRVADRAKDRKATRRHKRPSTKCQRWLQREARAIFEPSGVVFEADRFAAAARVMVQRTYPFQATLEIDVNLDVSHRGSQMTGEAGCAEAVFP